MASFAPVAPIQILESLYNYGYDAFGEYHLLLAHHIKEEPERFKTLFERIYNDMALFPTVIIDNSLVELGEAVALDMVRDATAIIKTACPVAEVVVVLPDVMGDGEGTRRALQKDAENWINAITCDGFMIVLQGKDDEDFDKTLQFVLDHKDEGVWKFVSWLSVPRKRVEAAGSRGDDIAKVLGVTEEFNIHLLGFSENLVDDIKCSRIPGVVGIDSAVPMRIENEFTVPMETPARDPNWFKDGILTPQAIQNLQIARDYVENLKGL